jgi:hypothetical protein
MSRNGLTEDTTAPYSTNPLTILIRPMRSFEGLRGRPVRGSMSFLLTYGLVTSVLSAVLATFVGVDYSNPSNCGGSAQLFAHWVVFEWLKSSDWLSTIVFFVLSNELGYLILGAVSGLIIAGGITVLDHKPLDDFLRPGFSAVCYGMTPGLILGWIPNPFFLVGILALIYQAVAIWVMSDLSAKRTVALVLLWVVSLALVQDLVSFVFMVLYQ